MKCPKCQALNRDHRSFCRCCGFRLLLPCPQCGVANEIEDTYCGGCGRSVKETTPATSIQSDAAPGQIPSSSTLSHAYLAKILEEERVEAQSDLNETKKVVNQEEIDKLFEK